MFYGLSKVLKQLLPKQLFYRGLLIVALPIVILQITISVVFFDSLWIKTNKGMTRALVGEIKTFIDLYTSDGVDKSFIENTFEQYSQIDVIYFNEKEFSDLMNEKWYSPIDRSLRRELKSKNLNYWFDTSRFKNTVNLKIQVQSGYFDFFIPRDRLTSTSVRIFALWITLPAILIVAIAIIFLKNQTRPIKKLAEVSKKFGRGEDIEEFVPSGASEIRQAGFEFEKMRKRILRHLNQRSEMLSGISHDLRTPLTRMKLQISLMKDEKAKSELETDVNEMTSMLDSYVSFVKTESPEPIETIIINELIGDIVKTVEKNGIELTIKEKNTIQTSGRQIQLKRAFNNIIDNSQRYAKKIEIILYTNEKDCVIEFNDDGEGIPKNKYEDVFKPFFTLDPSRNKLKGESGLGLTITRDIIRSHGGDVKLSESNLGGLQLKVLLPL